MAGPSAAVPGYVASPTGGTGPGPAVAQGAGFGRIRRHEPVLFDYVFAYRGYLADSTRIYALGELPDPLVRGHAAMLDIQALLQREAKAGKRAGDIYAMALEHAESLGFGNHFMGAGDRRIRFVGHGIGLELDEYPFLARGQKMELQEGMVVALEPKLVFPGIGVVGIENTHLVTREGLSRLTLFPDEIVQID
jgi:Xaa-Pro aminopeptidase